MTVAAFMDLALNDETHGYYARSAQRTGRAGDFFTSVDVGPLFGTLLELQLAEMAELVGPVSTDPFVLVEAGAGNGRLAADILRSARTRHPAFYERIRLHLVETSPAARAAQPQALGENVDRLASSGASLPSSFAGVLVANELLDALPVHQVVMTREGLRETYVEARGGRLVTVTGPVSTPAVFDYLGAIGAALDVGWRAEVGLGAAAWIRDAARRLTRGFLIIVDYGHDARELYSASHSAGTLTSFTRHRSQGPEGTPEEAWLENPGEQDVTAHVDFTSVRAAAEAEGLVTIGFLDQTYFLMGLLQSHVDSDIVSGDAERRALKTLMMPGGLGSTHKVLVLGKNVGAPKLLGCSYRVRVT